MDYEQKRSLIAKSLLEAKKFVVGDEKPLLYCKSQELKKISRPEIEAVLKQFESEEVVKIIEYPDAFNISLDNLHDPQFEYRVEILKPEYLESLLPRKSAMRIMNELQDTLTGRTAEERARIRAIEMSAENKASNNKFHIEYKDDRIIRLNGKIELGKPQFGTNNEAIWLFLYENPNKPFTLEELKKETKAELPARMDKVVEKWGFIKGLKSAFFDFSNANGKEAIKFKNPVTL